MEKRHWHADACWIYFPFTTPLIEMLGTGKFLKVAVYQKVFCALLSIGEIRTKTSCLQSGKTKPLPVPTHSLGLDLFSKKQTHFSRVRREWWR